jgi:Concanavalin A-like lectin/glucanases superfamily
MALQVTAGNGIERTTDLLDYNSTYTWMGWFRFDSMENYGTPLMLWAGSYQNQDTIQRSGTTGNYTLEVWSGGGGIGAPGGPIPIVNGVWQHLAIVRESSTLCKAYFDGVLGLTHTGNIAGRTAITGMRTGVTSVNWDGASYAQKAWTVALSLEQIQSEQWTVRPHLPFGLYGWWPFLPGATERLRDFGGANRPWSAVGTVADTDPPPVAWGNEALAVVAQAGAVAPVAPRLRTLMGVGT